MLKLLKWDFLNFINRYNWLYYSFAAIVIVTAVLPDDIQYVSALIDGIAAIYSIFFYSFTIFLSAQEAIGWLRMEYSQLTLSLYARPWKILLSKLIISICINATGAVLTLLLWSVIGRYGMSNIVLFNGYTIFFQYIIIMLMLLIITMFSYITAKSFSFMRNRAGFATVLIFSLICILLIWLLSVFFIATGTWHVEIIQYGKYNGGFNISPNDKLKWLQTTFIMLNPFAIIAAGICGSSVLLKRRFERY